MFPIFVITAILNICFYSALISYSYKTKTCANDELTKADQNSRLAIFWISCILLVLNVINLIITIHLYKNGVIFDFSQYFSSSSIKTINIILIICLNVYCIFLLHYLAQTKENCVLDDNTSNINKTLTNSIYSAIMINCGLLGYIVGK
jgi:hypothetical protein